MIERIMMIRLLAVQTLAGPRGSLETYSLPEASSRDGEGEQETENVPPKFRQTSPYQLAPVERTAGNELIFEQ
jgi:hypothetical protein